MSDLVSFPGQQTDEKVLYCTKPEAITKYFAYLKVIIVCLLMLFSLQVVAINLPVFSEYVKIGSLIICAFLFVLGIWWFTTLHDKTEYFITDRRIVKFTPLGPFSKSTRTLFWDEAVKAKSYHKNPIFEKIFGIGSLEIHARTQDKDNVNIEHLKYHEDLANYIDKILYTFKNKPEELKELKSFVPKPKGKRD